MVNPETRSNSTNWWAVRGVDQAHVQTLARGVALALLEPVVRGEALGLGLDQGDGHGLARGVHPDAEHVVDAPAGAAAWATIDDLDGACGLLATDQILGPASRVEGWIDELGTRVGLAEPHAARSIAVAPEAQGI